MEQKNVDLIIENGTLVTMDNNHRILKNHSVAVKGTYIDAIDTTAEIRKRYQSKKTIDASKMVVMPGLVDTYGHAGHGMIKGIYHPDHGWPANELYFHASDEQWWYAEALLSGLERLKFGVTTGLTVVGATPARADSPVFSFKQAEAIAELGIRGMVAVGPPDPFYSHLQEPWSATLREKGKVLKHTFTFEDALSNTETVIKECSNMADGRVMTAVHYPYLFGRQAAHPRIPFEYKDEYVPVIIKRAIEIRELADTYKVIIHSHAFTGSIDYGLDKFGKTVVERLLGRDVIFCHSNGFSEREIETLGHFGVNIAVVPFTHENLYYGICPVVELLKSGANVTISTDGTAPYASYNLWRDISRVIWAQWTKHNDQKLLPCGKALRMVTIDAAKALGIDEHIGSLEAGKKADIILVNMNQPHLYPDIFLPRLLAFYAVGQDVDTVIVNGNVLMEGRNVKTVDEGDIIDQARAANERALRHCDISPYIDIDENFWTGWRYPDN